MLPLSHPAFVLDDFFSAEECRALIADAEAKGFAATGHLYPASYRNNDRRMADEPALAAKIFERLLPHLPPVHDEQGRLLRPIGLNPRFRFCRYTGGQRFSIHRDGAYCRPNGDASRLVCQIYLNDAAEFSGGHTRFFATQHDTTPVHCVRPKTGSAIVFDHQLWHDGEPVPSGTKYVLRADVMYAAAAQPEGHSGYIWRIARDGGGVLHTSSRDGTIRRWGKTPARVLGPGGSIGAMAIGEHVYGATRSGVLFRADFTSGGYEELRRVDAAVIDLLPNLVMSCADGTLRTTTQTRKVHEGWAAALAFLPRRDLIASVGHDGVLVLSRASDLTEVARYEHGRALYSVAASDFLLWLGDADGRVTQVRLACDDLRKEWSVPMHTGTVTTIARNGSLLATGGEDFSLRVCDLGNPAAALAVTEHKDFVRAVVWTDDRTCVSAGYDAVLRETRA